MNVDFSLDTSIDRLPATRSTTVQRLKKLGITTIESLLMYAPRRYEDRSILSSTTAVQLGEKVTISGTITACKNQFARNGLTIQTATLQDEVGEIDLIWFNQRYLARVLQQGKQFSVWGEVKEYRSKKVLFPQEFESIAEGKTMLHLGKLVPIYPETGGLSSKTIREKMQFALSALATHDAATVEQLPERILEEFNLLTRKDAFMYIHRPTTTEEIKMARTRLGFDELFVLQLGSHITRQAWNEERVGTPFTIRDRMMHVESFIDRLPFDLTASQQKAIQDILTDLSLQKPMNRFLQGDVGSGKTAVAAVAAYAAFLNGYSTLLMAPTEILAQQHHRTFTDFFSQASVPIQLVTGSTKKRSLTSDAPAIIIGTHALLHTTFASQSVGLVIIDEQHRFGVKQRAELKNRGMHPHLLTMTATPIPRTVALTIFGELDMSVLDEMPKNRLPIKSWVVPTQKRQAAYQWIDEQLAGGAQVYVICPLVDESDRESLAATKAAQKESERLAAEIFPHRKVGLLHGKMKPAMKTDVMQRFKQKEIDILVSTSVVEVGIDVPAATIILIEGAERFGLAQLHQLRGRVGRGDRQSYCLLFPTDLTSPQSPRLQFFATHSKGSDIAEYDLMSRGVGELYGTKQHGYTELKIASLADTTLIQHTREAVALFMKNYSLEDFPRIRTALEERSVTSIAKD